MHRIAIFGLLLTLAAPFAVGCGDEAAQQSTTTDETYTTSEGDEDPDAPAEDDTQLPAE